MSYKKSQFNNSEKNYYKLLNKKSNIEAKLDSINESINKAKSEYVTNGILYYNEEKRNSIITKAENLCYSQEILNRLKSICSEEWNQDNINEETISDFKSAEEFIRKHTPKLEKSIISKLGNGVLGSNKERNK